MITMTKADMIDIIMNLENVSDALTLIEDLEVGEYDFNEEEAQNFIGRINDSMWCLFDDVEKEEIPVYSMEDEIADYEFERRREIRNGMI